MSTFALDTGSSPGDVISALNYALANLGTSVVTSGNTSANIGANVVYVNTTTGAITSNVSGTIGYLYGYVNVKYANTATGSSGFTSNSTGAYYYGVHNTTDGTISNNPVDYNWLAVTGGFGTTKGLYYAPLGGGQVQFQPAATAPDVHFSAVLDNIPVSLIALANSIVTTNTITPGAVTNVSIAASTITGNNIQAGTITGNLIAANTIIGTNIVGSTITGNLIAANTIQGVNIQAGTITANLLAAGTIIVANSIQSNNATFGSTSSAGYWLDSSTGNVRFGGNTSIGNNLTVGSNTVVGGNLTVGANASIGGNLNVTGLVTSGNLQANTVPTTSIVLQGVSTGTGVTTYNIQTYTGLTNGVDYPYVWCKPTVTTTVSNQNIYVNGNYLAALFTNSSNAFTLIASLYRQDMSTTSNTLVARSRSIVSITSSVYYYYNPVFQIFDTPNPFGTGTYQYFMTFQPYDFAGFYTQLQFQSATLVLQGMKR
jgi:hypothetical protein